jgi:3-dehydroquinate dehydratase
MTLRLSIEKRCREFASFPGVELHFSQSNHEGAMVDTVQATVRTVGKLPAALPAPLAVGPV